MLILVLIIDFYFRYGLGSFIRFIRLKLNLQNIDLKGFKGTVNKALQLLPGGYNGVTLTVP